MPIEVSTVVPGEVDALWPLLADGMDKSCRASSAPFKAGWLWQECRSGQAFLIVAHESGTVLGGAVVQFQDAGRLLRGLALCGTRFREWFPALQGEVRKIMEWGGAERFVDTGRPGLARLYRGIPHARVIGTTVEVRR